MYDLQKLETLYEYFVSSSDIYSQGTDEQKFELLKTYHNMMVMQETTKIFEEWLSEKFNKVLSPLIDLESNNVSVGGDISKSNMMLVNVDPSALIEYDIKYVEKHIDYGLVVIFNNNDIVKEYEGTNIYGFNPPNENFDQRVTLEMKNAINTIFNNANVAYEAKILETEALKLNKSSRAVRFN